MSQALSIQEKVKREIMELSESINQIVDSYRKLRNPLLESHENVPKATKQLDKVSEQTEAATQRMLDMVEKITEREQEVISGLKSIQEMSSTDSSREISKIAGQLIVKAETTRNDAYTIMDALQFQDITAQQISHAMSLLEDLETKLDSILETLRGEGEKSRKPESEESRRKRAFDPHADLYEKQTQQEDIDSLFARNKQS